MADEMHRLCVYDRLEGIGNMAQIDQRITRRIEEAVVTCGSNSEEKQVQMKISYCDEAC